MCRDTLHATFNSPPTVHLLLPRPSLVGCILVFVSLCPYLILACGWGPECIRLLILQLVLCHILVLSCAFPKRLSLYCRGNHIGRELLLRNSELSGISWSPLATRCLGDLSLAV